MDNAALDQYITGNYGEDQLEWYDRNPEQGEPPPCPECGAEAEWILGSYRQYRCTDCGYTHYRVPIR